MHTVKLFSACRAFAALLAVVSGCGSNSSADESGFRLELRAEVGMPKRYRVVLAEPNSSVSGVTCPGGSSSKLRCTASGVAIEAPEVGSTFTIKPAGYEFVSVTLAADHVAKGRLPVELSPLGEFKATNDYRTGFDREGGATAFAALAVETQTEFGPAQSLKFYVAGFDKAPQVYFQNTRRYPLHYDFARFALGVGTPRPIFEQNTYHGENRSALAGTLIYYPKLEFQQRCFEVRAFLRFLQPLRGVAVRELSASRSKVPSAVRDAPPLPAVPRVRPIRPCAAESFLASPKARTERTREFDWQKCC